MTQPPALPVPGVLSLVDIQALENDLGRSAAAYRAAQPFPHVVLEDVLTPGAFAAASADFPPIGDPFWKGYLHVNETKYGNTEPDTWAPAIQAVARELCSAEFVAYLEALTGIEGLVPDWTMDGGGLHQTLRGGHLNVHTDFSTHHVHENWSRRVNILLYLNREWRPEWGGELELWDVDMTRAQAKVAPLANRMLIFTTSAESYHGHPDPLTCPPDVARCSMALYYFTPDDNAVRRSTHYRPRPEDARTKAAAIVADRKAVDLYDRVKRRLGLSDKRVHSLLRGLSSIARRRRDRSPS